MHFNPFLNHSFCCSDKGFEVNSSSSDSALAGASGFGGICIGFTRMCGSVERFRQRIKLEIADRDIVIPVSSRLLWICLSVARSRYQATGISCWIGINLLRQGKMTISEISEQTGFSSIQTFSKNFRKIYGVSPRSYIKMEYERKQDLAKSLRIPWEKPS